VLSRGAIVADGLSVTRALLTAPFVVACVAQPAAHPVLSWLPLGLFALAAASDFADGRLARASGSASGRGQLLDTGADVLFLGGALVLFAARGRIPWVVPGAMGAAVAMYAHDSWRRARGSGMLALDRSTVGHAAGVANFALVGLLAAEHGFPTWLAARVVDVGALATASLNAASAGQRLAGRWRHGDPGASC
jgi:phosphatidylglycerophosphate synthase